MALNIHIACGTVRKKHGYLCCYLAYLCTVFRVYIQGGGEKLQVMKTYSIRISE